jgi:hypothetical protein
MCRGSKHLLSTGHTACDLSQVNRVFRSQSQCAKTDLTIALFTFCFISYNILLPSSSRCYEIITQTTRPSLLWCPAIWRHNIRVRLSVPLITLLHHRDCVNALLLVATHSKIMIWFKNTLTKWLSLCKCKYWIYVFGFSSCHNMNGMFWQFIITRYSNCQEMPSVLWHDENSKMLIQCLIETRQRAFGATVAYLLFYVSFKNFSLISKRYHCRWWAANLLSLIYNVVSGKFEALSIS